jgi:hypothetical protein
MVISATETFGLVAVFVTTVPVVRECITNVYDLPSSHLNFSFLHLLTSIGNG